MKTSTAKRKTVKFEGKNKGRSIKTSHLDIIPLVQDISEAYRETTSPEIELEKTVADDWNESQDRGEDLVNIRDPLVQEPEYEAEIPPELIQKKTRGTKVKNVADRFDAERKSRPPF